MKSKRGSGDDVSKILQGAIPDIMSINDGSRTEQNSDLAIKQLNIHLLRPDPVQPRRILPERIHHEYHAQKLSPHLALGEWIQLANTSARLGGRSFHNPFEMVETREETEIQMADLSAEESSLLELVRLALTLKDDGQVLPITVVDISRGVAAMFMIETGERRFWATWLLQDFYPGYSHTGQIPCIIVPKEKVSPFRQAKENTSRVGLNSVAMARQVALLLIHIHGIQIPTEPVGMDFYRQALNLDLRDKREYTSEVLSALGSISKSQLSEFKALLKLSDEALEIADRYNVEYRKLRYVVQLETVADQIELMNQIIEMNLSVKQIQDIVEKGSHVRTFLDEDEIQLEKLPKSATQLAKLVLNPDNQLDAEKIARAFVGLERDKAVSIARLKAIRGLLEDVEKAIYDS